MESANDLFLLMMVIYCTKLTTLNGRRPRVPRVHVSLNCVLFDRVIFLAFINVDC